jgi:5-methyltetrahydrofolate--homocysteine methyltransferase
MLRLGDTVTVFDGAMGSELEKLGFCGVPEELNITHPDVIQNIHRSYACADCIMTNTFGLNRIKYKGSFGLKELALKAVENARVAGKKVIFDIGPTGAMIEPLGTLTFDEAYDAFAEIVEITKDVVDGYIAETFSDLYEIKACILAVKEHSNKPLFATMTFDGAGRTLTGSTPEIVANTLEGLGVDALGVNCSGGPKELEGVVARFLKCSGVPVMVKPNRGLPTLKNGRTEYVLEIEEFDFYIKKFIDMGVSIVGGCCGTNPEFIKKISRFSGRKVVRRAVERVTVVNSATRSVTVDGVKICGERLNPTGKKKLKEALICGNYDFLIDEAVAQQEAGADVLDLNVGVPGLDEKSVMKTACRKIQEYVDLPLQIDSSDVSAIESGARYYNGVPIINSVNGEDNVLDAVLPVVKKYGAVVIGLTMDGRGVPPTAEKRFEIAKKIIKRAEEYGIPRHKIIIDTLVLTASAEQKLVKETTKALRLVRSLGVKTALGVSNVSFGLPNRGLLNRTFLTMAMTCGLNMPIMNPLDGEMTGAVKAFGVLSGEDENSENYIEIYKDFSGTVTALNTPKTEHITGSNLYACIKKGLKNEAAALCAKELENTEPMTVVNDILIKALEEVGALYDSGKLYLPQLVSSAEAAKKAFEAVGKAMPKGTAKKAKIILATVKGDVHDIGKNIVKVVLESYGYDVIDLGKDVPPEAVVEAYFKHMAGAIGLSALMTTTVKSMEETIAALKCAGCKCPVFVGGAVLSAETARKIGADYYTRDALEFVKVLDKIL